MTKKEKRRARHDRRVKNRLSRRALLRRAGTAALGLAASVMMPMPIKANVPARIPSYRTNLPAIESNALAPTWTKLLEHIGGSDPRLRTWVHDLVLRPQRPQRPLLLTGADHQSKDVFHDALGLLLPSGGVVRMPEDMNYPPLDLTSEWWLEPDPRLLAERERKLKAAWLMVVNEPLVWYMRLHERPRFRDGRFLKWSFTCEAVPRGPRPMPPVIRYDVRSGILLPTPDLLRRLERESELFRRSLAKAA